MATSKSGGSTSNGRDSIGKRLGCKRFDNQFVNCGEILVRQRGTKVNPGNNVKRGKDDTLFAIKPGFVKYYSGFKGRKFVKILEKLEA
ncbi:TPA: 50S ribosomal protein L27 [Candidatus Dependentiae bacterium]|nr:MAG: Ribosomal protein L27 [candidate division TM6 bacterium GW2011_GWE2_31_21]KKP53204.1 MAG: Ribosomal protein L27 [candidate division TM6 bacterium GW2011_GWF2_33_332]HBS48022.1 50S ribosomal protein L27 [Candidatus Dependentiae bacterium]HBZ73374.1 50S ribosomal protein L27 [Candidatus Dependentiae bacterium]